MIEKKFKNFQELLEFFINLPKSLIVVTTLLPYFLL